MRSEVQHLKLSGHSQNPLSSSFPIIHEGTASASAKIEHNSNRCHGEMYFDIVLVYYYQREKRTPPRPATRRRGDGGGQVMQLSLHDVIGQSWVSHVGPSFSVFFFRVGFVFGGLLPLGPLFFSKRGRGIQGQCDQSMTKLINIQVPPVVGLPRWQSWQCSLLTESEEFVALLLAGCLSGDQILLSVQ